jgi:hypothetical protein
MSSPIREKKPRPSSAAIASARNLWTVLCQMSSGKKLTAPRTLAQACVTQATLAKYAWPEKEIRPLSLNTLKAAAEEGVEPGGWAALDEVRKKVHLQSLSQKDRNLKEKRRLGFRLASAADTIRMHEARVQALLRSRFTLLQAYGDAIDLLKTYQHLNPSLAKRLERHESMFDLKLITEAEVNDEQR